MPKLLSHRTIWGCAGNFKREKVKTKIAQGTRSAPRVEKAQHEKHTGMVTQMDARVAMRPRHRRSKDEQRELYARVVQTSLQFFAEGGYEAISMRRLATEVGVAPMSLYRYFPTKAHLIRHLWDAILSEASEQARSRLDEQRTPLKRLAAYVDGYLQYWLDNKEHYWVVFSLRDDSGDLHAEEGAYILRPNPQHFLLTLAELVNDCVGRGRIHEIERRHLNEALLCKSLGFLAGVIGLSALPWQNVDDLKHRAIADMTKQVGEACTGGKPRANGPPGKHRLTA